MPQKLGTSRNYDIELSAVEGLRLAIQSLLPYLPKSRAALNGVALMLSCYRGELAASLLALIPVEVRPSVEEALTYRKKTEEVENRQAIKKAEEPEEELESKGPSR